MTLILYEKGIFIFLWKGTLSIKGVSVAYVIYQKIITEVLWVPNKEINLIQKQPFRIAFDFLLHI